MTSSQPKTVIFFAWLGASRKLVAKYVDGIKKLYPDASIYPIMCDMADVMRTTRAQQEARFRPALQSVLSDDSNSLLVLCYSNGGAYHFDRFARLYVRDVRRPLPVKAILFDSTPGYGGFNGNVPGMLASIPTTLPVPVQYLFRALIIIVIGLFVILNKVLGRPDWNEIFRVGLNDPQLVNINAKKTYVYSKADPIIDTRGVAEHAANARKEGWMDVDEFPSQAPGHVRQMAVDPEQYWSTVERTWKAGLAASKD